MTDTKHEKAASRRVFLRKTALGGGVVAAAAAAPTAVLGSEDTPMPEASKPKGYRLSRHVLDYYKSLSE